MRSERSGTVDTMIEKQHVHWSDKPTNITFSTVAASELVCRCPTPKNHSASTSILHHSRSPTPSLPSKLNTIVICLRIILAKRESKRSPRPLFARFHTFQGTQRTRAAKQGGFRGVRMIAGLACSFPVLVRGSIGGIVLVGCWGPSTIFWMISLAGRVPVEGDAAVWGCWCCCDGGGCRCVGIGCS